MRGFPDATMASKATKKYKLLPYFSILFTCLVILVCFRPLYKRFLDRFFKFSQPKTVPNREKQDTIFSAVERLVGMFPFQLIQKFKNWIREFKSKKLNPRGPVPVSSNECGVVSEFLSWCQNGPPSYCSDF